MVVRVDEKATIGSRLSSWELVRSGFGGYSSREGSLPHVLVGACAVCLWLALRKDGLRDGKKCVGVLV